MITDVKFALLQISKLQSQIETQDAETSGESEFEKSESQRLSLESEKEELLKQIKEYEEKYANLESVCKYNAFIFMRSLCLRFVPVLKFLCHQGCTLIFRRTTIS